MPPGLGLGLGLGRSLVGPSWWGYLEPPILNHLGALLERFRAVLEAIFGVLEASWAV